MDISWLTDEIISAGWLVIPGIVLLAIGMVLTIIDKNRLNVKWVMGWVFLWLAGYIFVISGKSLMDIPDTPIVRSVEKHPVEHRTENNTLYVFYDNHYHKVSSLTDKFITNQDTLYIYTTLKIGGQLMWSTKIEKTFEPLEAFVWEDSVEVIQTPQRITLSPEDLSTKPPESQVDSLLNYLQNYP